MTDIAQLAVEVKTGDVSRARRELDQLTASGRRTESAVDGISSAFAGKLRGAIGGLGLGLLVREVIQTADAYTSLTARLGLVTNSTIELERAQSALFQIAQESRVGLGATADLFTSLSRSTQALGKTQTEVLGVTETINQALIVSGTSAQSASAALTQLGQGFASGVLRGEELNSVLEQTPRLAQAIADGLGVSVGRLRALGQAGKLTAEEVFGALQSQAEKLRGEFDRMPTTVAQSFQQIGNSVSALIGDLDAATGATSSLARGLTSISRAIDQFRGQNAAEGTQERVAAYRIERQELENLVRIYESRGRVLGNDSPEKQRISELRQLEDAYVSARRAAEAREAALGRNERARRFDPVANELRQQAAAGDLLKKYATDAEKLQQALAAAKTELGALFTPEIESRIRASFTRSGQASPFADEIKALRERAVLLGQDTELQRVNAQIQLGRFGSLRPAQEQELRLLASSVDARQEQVDALRAEEQARDAATAAITRAAQQQGQDLQALQDGNRALREEIELIGADEQMQAAIAIARTRSTRTLKEERLARLEASGVAEEQLQVLQAEIEALTEREQLLNQRSFASTRAAAEEEAKRAGDAYRSSLGQSIEEGILDGFRSGRDLIDIFIDELKAQFARTVLRPLIQPVADAQNQLISSLIGAAVGAFTGGGVPSGDGSGATGDFARFDRSYGGPLETGTNRIKEDALYMLHKDEAVVPARYNPAVGGQASQNPAPNVIVNLIGAPEGSRVDRKTQANGDLELTLIMNAAADEVDRRIASGGSTARTIQSTFGLRRNTNRRT